MTNEPKVNTGAVKAYYREIDKEIYFSFPLITKLLTEYKVTGSQLAIYMSIADYLLTHRGEDRNAITLDYIAETTGINKTTVFNNMPALEEKGLIKRWVPTGTRHRTTRYDFKVIK